MSEKLLMKGNEAVAQGAIDAGCTHFFGYPITPQNQICEYMSVHLRAAGGVFIQAESEISAINMTYGAAAAGGRVMTSSSGPGIALKQEGISYMIGAELPCLIVNMVRGGPGLGNIAAAQSDYWLATRGGGHGDGHVIVYAASTVQELYDLPRIAFEVADEYRNPTMILGDAILGQMMEPVDMQGPSQEPLPEKPWTTTGAKGRPRNIINSLHIDPQDLEQHCRKLEGKYRDIAANQTLWDEYGADDPEVLVTAYGTSARVCRSAVSQALEEGIRARLLRPITLFPFPRERMRELAERAQRVLVVEMSLGQYLEDVRLVVEGCAPIRFHGRTGGIVPTPEDVVTEIRAALRRQEPMAEQVAAGE